MMTIGRFAQLSGLSIAALRHYDDTGLLVPARVDPDTGYRWYRPGQARRAATISLLRSTGMPLDRVRRAVDSPDRLQDELDRWRCDQVADRARQDTAIAAATSALEAYERPVPVVRRSSLEQHYLGLVLDASSLGSDPEAGAAAMQAAWERVAAALADRGVDATGAWTTVRPEEPGARAQLVLCLGLPQPWTGGSGARYEHGTLPARTELAVVLEPDAVPPPSTEDGAPPAPLLALLEELDRTRDATAGTVRQTPLVDEQGRMRGLEVCVALEQA